MTSRRLLSLSILLCSASVSILVPWHNLWGQGPSPATTEPMAPFDADPELNALLKQVVLKHLPHTWEKNKGWGDQAERWDGIRWERDGLKIRTHRRKKLVNHGTWRKYSVSLADPQHGFHFALANFHQADDGPMAFDIACSADLTFDAREAEWVKGVQLYSFSANGHASVRLTITMSVSLTLSTQSGTPELVVTPRATGATLVVDEFRIDRVSKLGGEFAQQVSRFARQELDDKIEEKRDKLLAKINQELEKHADELKVTLGRVMKKASDK